MSLWNNLRQCNFIPSRSTSSRCTRQPVWNNRSRSGRSERSAKTERREEAHTTKSEGQTLLRKEKKEQHRCQEVSGCEKAEGKRCKSRYLFTPNFDLNSDWWLDANLRLCALLMCRVQCFSLLRHHEE